MFIHIRVLRPPFILLYNIENYIQMLIEINMIFHSQLQAPLSSIHVSLIKLLWFDCI